LGRASGYIPASRRLVIPLAVAAGLYPSVCPSSARADDGEAPVLALDIEEAARRAADASPLVRRARAQREPTAARRAAARLPLPSSAVIAGWVGRTWTDGPALARGQSPSRELGAAAHLEQTVEVGGQRGMRRAEVARAVDAARARERVAEVESRARARTAYVA